MTRRICRQTIVMVGALCAFATWPSAAERRPIAEKDIFKFVWVADPQIAPDGSQVAFVRVSIDEKKDAYETSIWLARTDAPKRMAASRRVRSRAARATSARAGPRMVAASPS